MAFVTSTLSEALDALSRGEIVAYPTETFYGLGVDATNREAIRRLLSLKNRPPFKPFPILLPRPEALGKYVKPIPPAVRALISAYWPGPLTVVLRAKGLPTELCNRSGGVGFRVTAHPLANQLVGDYGRCITTTSANPSGRKSAQSASDVVHYFHGVDLCVLDGGPTAGGQASTVVEIPPGESPVLLREGPVSLTEIERVMSQKKRSRS